MEFIRSQTVEAQQEDAVQRLKNVLDEEGFASVRLEAEEESDGDQGSAPAASTLLLAFCRKLVPRLVDAAEGARLLLTTTFLARESGNQTMIGVISPDVLSLLPEQQDLQSVVDEMQLLVERILDAVTKPQQNEQSAERTEAEQTESSSEVAADEVKQRLYAVIIKGTDTVADGEVGEHSESIFIPSKAYAAVASLHRAEEVELHLS